MEKISIWIVDVSLNNTVKKEIWDIRLELPILIQ